MATTVRTFSWLSLLDQEELSHNRVNTIEYEFTSRAGVAKLANVRTHEGGMRVFRAGGSARGAYSAAAAEATSLAWGGLSLTWDGEQLTWGGA